MDNNYLEICINNVYSTFDKLIQADTKYKHLSTTQFQSVYKKDPYELAYQENSDYAKDILTKTWIYANNFSTYVNDDEPALFMLDKVVKCVNMPKSVNSEQKYGVFCTSIIVSQDPEQPITVDFGLLSDKDDNYVYIVYCKDMAEAESIFKNIIYMLENVWNDNFDINLFQKYVDEHFPNNEKCF